MAGPPSGPRQEAVPESSGTESRPFGNSSHSDKQWRSEPIRDAVLHARLTALANHHDAAGARETETYTPSPLRLDVVDYPSEPTSAGEQFVIPECERNRLVALRQLDLFG